MMIHLRRHLEAALKTRVAEIIALLMLCSVLFAVATGADGPQADQEKKRRLCAQMVDKRERVRQQAAEALEKIDPMFYRAVLWLRDNDDASREGAARMIAENPDDFAPAVPIVADRISTIGASLDARSAKIEGIDKRAGDTPKIKELLACLDCVASIGAKDELAEKSLLDAISSIVAPEVRQRALQRLADVKVINKKRRLEVLSKALKSDFDSNKAPAADALGLMGTDARPALDALRKAKGSGDAILRQSAARAVKAIETAE